MALKSDASRYFLGYIWWVLEPLLFVMVFYVVFGIILNTGRADFLTFLICGKLPFVWFSKSVSVASNSIVTNSGLIGRLDLPKTMFPMAIIQEGVYKQTAVFGLLMVYLMSNGFEPTAMWFWLIPLIFVNYIMIIACSFIGAVLVCFSRDVSMLIPLAMIFLMFVSGIFWDVRSLPDPAMMDYVLVFNPLAFILDGYRQVLMYNTMPDIPHFLAIGLAFSFLTGLMVFIMRRYSQVLALKALTA